MKKISLILVVLFGFILSSCGDMEEEVSKLYPITDISFQFAINNEDDLRITIKVANEVPLYFTGIFPIADMGELEIIPSYGSEDHTIHMYYYSINGLLDIKKAAFSPYDYFQMGFDPVNTLPNSARIPFWRDGDPLFRFEIEAENVNQLDLGVYLGNNSEQDLYTGMNVALSVVEYIIPEKKALAIPIVKKGTMFGILGVYGADSANNVSGGIFFLLNADKIAQYDRYVKRVSKRLNR